MNIKIIIQPEISVIAIGYTAPTITDNPVNKTITAKFNLIANNQQEYDYPLIVLWDELDYDKIGQWTDEVVAKKINEILNK